jgi:hypothetical protein
MLILRLAIIARAYNSSLYQILSLDFLYLRELLFILTERVDGVSIGIESEVAIHVMLCWKHDTQSGELGEPTEKMSCARCTKASNRLKVCAGFSTFNPPEALISDSWHGS